MDADGKRINNMKLTRPRLRVMEEMDTINL